MLTFKYKGHDFRMTDWNTDDFSDSIKGLVEVDTDYGWIEVIEYESFEGESKLVFLNEYEYTKKYTELDYFVFNEKHVLDFLKEYENKKLELVK